MEKRFQVATEVLGDWNSIPKFDAAEKTLNDAIDELNKMFNDAMKKIQEDHSLLKLRLGGF